MEMVTIIFIHEMIVVILHYSLRLIAVKWRIGNYSELNKNNKN